MFADWELIGIPHRLVISDKGLDEQTFEYKGRRDKEPQKISGDQLIDFLKSKILI
jgi:prolyl-tRNA synthetase